jgi:dTMP kinase
VHEVRGRGRFIAFEGGEGAGKSTQARVLASALGAELTREPGGSDLGEEIRRLLLGPAGTAMDPRAELMLMLAARAQHVTERIRPALESGRDVVVDRYSGSTLAYQGYGRGLPLAAVKEACDLATSDLWPDLSVLLDVPVNLGAARRAGAGEAPDRIESERREFHDRVTAGFRRLAADDPEHWVVIDGIGAPDEVAALVRHAVDSMLGQTAVS